LFFNIQPEPKRVAKILNIIKKLNLHSDILPQNHTTHIFKTKCQLLSKKMEKMAYCLCK